LTHGSYKLNEPPHAPQSGTKHSRKMIALYIVGFLAVASAAPRYHSRHSPFYHDPGFSSARYGDFEMHPSFGEEIFDTRRFWSDLESQLRQMDEMIANFHHHFPNTESTAGVDGKTYKVTIPLSGFDEKNIIVKAREGVLMVQAIHKIDEGSARSFLNVHNLPANVDIAGVWTFENELLTVVFPLKGVTTTEAPVTTVPVTKAPESREEMSKNDDNDNQDADVGAKDVDSKENAINSNEIFHGVEATTYAVDLKNEVEFVPVRYR
jgi:HSP20 family molecular chaperone IbpA